MGLGRLELSSEEVREGIASFYYDLTAATSEAQLGAILKLVPVSQLLMGLDNPFMPKSTLAPAIGRWTLPSIQRNGFAKRLVRKCLPLVPRTR